MAQYFDEAPEKDARDLEAAQERETFASLFTALGPRIDPAARKCARDPFFALLVATPPVLASGPRNLDGPRLKHP